VTHRGPCQPQTCWDSVREQRGCRPASRATSNQTVKHLHLLVIRPWVRHKSCLTPLLPRAVSQAASQPCSSFSESEALPCVSVPYPVQEPAPSCSRTISRLLLLATASASSGVSCPHLLYPRRGKPTLYLERQESQTPQSWQKVVVLSRGGGGAWSLPARESVLQLLGVQT